MWHCGYASSPVLLKNGCRNLPSADLGPKFNFGKQLRLNRKCRDELFAIEQIKDDQHDVGRSPFQFVLQIRKICRLVFGGYTVSPSMIAEPAATCHASEEAACKSSSLLAGLKARTGRSILDLEMQLFGQSDLLCLEARSVSDT